MFQINVSQESCQNEAFGLVKYDKITDTNPSIHAACCQIFPRLSNRFQDSLRCYFAIVISGYVINNCRLEQARGDRWSLGLIGYLG